MFLRFVVSFDIVPIREYSKIVVNETVVLIVMKAVMAIGTKVGRVCNGQSIIDYEVLSGKEPTDRALLPWKLCEVSLVRIPIGKVLVVLFNINKVIIIKGNDARVSSNDVRRMEWRAQARGRARC